VPCGHNLTPDFVTLHISGVNYLHSCNPMNKAVGRFEIVMPWANDWIEGVKFPRDKSPAGFISRSPLSAVKIWAVLLAKLQGTSTTNRKPNPRQYGILQLCNTCQFIDSLAPRCLHTALPWVLIPFARLITRLFSSIQTLS
jgi:hypothetical protein